MSGCIKHSSMLIRFHIRLVNGTHLQQSPVFLCTWLELGIFKIRPLSQEQIYLIVCFLYLAQPLKLKFKASFPFFIMIGPESRIQLIGFVEWCKKHLFNMSCFQHGVYFIFGFHLPLLKNSFWKWLLFFNKFYKAHWTVSIFPQSFHYEGTQ
jgi:hypothetical protein